MTAKYTWRVAPVPTGRYRSFDKRGWPAAVYANGSCAAIILCEDEYRPRDIEEGKHAPLTLIFDDYSTTPSKRKKLVRTFLTLKEAKEAFADLLKRRPEIAPTTKGEVQC